MFKNKTKIVATIGPATSSKEVLTQIIQQGVNVCRINFSHGSHQDHLRVITFIKQINKELGSNVSILADLQGPKLRIGEVENNAIQLAKGDEIVFTNEKCLGTKQKVYMSYKGFAQDVKVGEKVLVDDGKLLFEVVQTNSIDSVTLKTIHGGILSSKKGVNLPNTQISQPALTDKDLEDVTFALYHNVDWIALSFVRSAKDVIALREIIDYQKKHAKVIAKIEKPEAVENLDSIIEVTDGIMVARGDLGVEMPFEQVPIIQKKIIEKCITFAKPVIIATQMLESMIQNPTPTRAEANDVANAVLDSATAVMLSGETGVGAYPVETINAMRQIITYTEQQAYPYYKDHIPQVMKQTYIPDSVCQAACTMAKQAQAAAIVVLTFSGYTAYRIASHRPNAKIFVFTPNKYIARQISLLWGIKAFVAPIFTNTDEAVAYTMQHLKDSELVDYNNYIVHIGSIPLDKDGQSNTVKLSKFGEIVR